MKVKLAAATWTNLSTQMAALGQHVNVYSNASDVSVGRKATAPTAGVLLLPKEAVEVIVKHGDTLVLWAYSTAGADIYLDRAGAKRVLLDGTGTT